MNMQLKKIALAVICITTIGIANIAFAAPQPNTPPTKLGTVGGSPKVALNSISSISVPSQLNVGDSVTFVVNGKGVCDVRLHPGAANNVFSYNYEGAMLPLTISYDDNYKLYGAPYQLAPGQAEKVFRVWVTSKNCPILGASEVFITVKNPNQQADSPTNIPGVKGAANPPTLPNQPARPTQPTQPSQPGGGLAPPLPTLTAISISPNTAPAGKLIFKVDGTGYCKYHISYIVKDVPLAMVPNVPYASSAQEKFPMTLTLGKPGKAGTYTYTAAGYDGCKGSVQSEPIIVP